MSASRHRQVVELFHEALEQQPSDRAQLLRQRCGEDRQLRAEVESLLAHHDSRTITIEPDLTRLAERVKTDSPTQRAMSPAARAGQLLRGANRYQLGFAVAAVCLAAILGGLGWGAYRGIHQRLRANLAGQLAATLDSNVAAVDNWLQLQLREIESWAQHPHLQRLFAELVEQQVGLASDSPGANESSLQIRLAELLTKTTRRPEVVGVSGVNRNGQVVFSASHPEAVRRTLSDEGRRRLQPVFLGGSVLFPPTTEGTFFSDDRNVWAGVPLIVVGSAVRSPAGDVLGGLFLGVRAAEDFTSLLDLGRAGPRCDTYAFNREGQLLSKSLYEEELRELGLLPKSPTSSSVLHVTLRDPGLDLTKPHTRKTRREERPLTKMAADATQGRDGMDLDGYRDYRGVLVVGAWKWLDRYGFAVATEIERKQAYAALDFLQRLAGRIVGLLAVLGTAAFVFAIVAARLNRQVSEVRQLGQYSLEKLIGEGGMGRVYLARHAMLRRPTAIKMLDGRMADVAAVKRFEREVQLVSSLTHPNTIEIYDYGRTTEGVFYFAMEFVDGLTLETLLTNEGPIPVSRLLWIMQQVLGSLAEAHGRGLVHRDVKPANLMLCRRGGVADWVKVVDFGLAKGVQTEAGTEISRSGMISGTPQYIAPECLQDASDLSPATDVYAVGVTAFKLLTGRDLFVGSTIVEVFSQVLRAAAPRVSEVVGDRIPSEVDDLVARCVERRGEDRPRDAGELLELWRPLAARYPWTRAEAEAWWSRYQVEQGDVPGPPSAGAD